ncbi:PREDICTED: kinesin-like protein KIF18A isoform X1 [Poecilia mexicana]|uniref:Kinesin-like protein n=1 Tax=Poecilia mexicana TaxID=48701 RepID=A0A3B3X6U1_9TELE|nr:PREDICTED: kinesin-like protein KIF18A isoform X1 [Poecilia mexicana]XP_014854314.1 PREDICTED: kinesin-like protein KIF18A isoform X1 [Poecilia mexicana]
MASDVCSHVKVVVRVRPTNDSEKRENCRNVVQVVDNHMLIFDPKEEDMSCFGSQRVRSRNINKRANKDLKFVFDHVFDENSTQLDIFENTTKGVLDGVMNGFNCTVFAYGATGAGKTHTMLGSQNDPGVMYRTMKELFKRMDDAKEEKEFTLAFSYLEVYNEQIRDLLANVGPLAVREDSSKGVVVQGLTLHKPKSAEHILEALDSGNRNRTQHPTDMNATSSRSHAVFQIYLRQQDKTASLNPNVCIAKMSLIDLAGSERASATNAKGARLREGANINRSLLALGNVINALADPKSKKAHIPYRDSKLTRILKDSLGGNCRTVMIANVSPSSKSYDDTQNTLKYANRAKEIKSSLKSNVVSLDSHIGQYAVICEKQRQEILQLKQKLKEYEEKNAVASNTISSQKQAEFKRVSEALQSIFSSRAQIRREQLDLERQLKANELRQCYSEEDNLQVQHFCAKEKMEKATCKHERKIASLRTQHQHISKRLKETETRFLENDGLLHRVENEIKLLKSNDQTSEVLEKDLYCHRLELQVNDLKQHIKQMVELTSLQDQENKRMQKMLNILLPAYSRQYAALHGVGLVSLADEMENQDLEHVVLRERGVVWADQEGTGQQVKTEEIGDDSLETCGARKVRLHSELAPVLSFSHLHYHQSSPCSAERLGKRAFYCSAAPTLKDGGDLPDKTGDKPPKVSIRRNLSTFLPPQSPQSVVKSQAFEDGMLPLQCTPEPAQLPPGCSSSMDPNKTFEIIENDDQTASNATIILSYGSPCQASTSADVSGSSQLKLPHRAAEGNQTSAKRQNIGPLQETKRTNPTYMDMTSAAQGKRKFNRSFKEEFQGFSAPKRIKKESSVAQRPLRVQRFTGSENKPRRVVRSVSEGNLSVLEHQKPKSLFYKTSQQIKRVAKRM